MTIDIIKNISLGLEAVPIAAESSNLQEFEKGRIHHINEMFSRLNLVYLTKDFFATTFSKNNQKPLSTKSSLAIICTPLMLASLKSSYASNYISKKVVHAAIRVEKYIGSLCYIASIINAVALISFGHLITGYAALTVFGLDMLTSSIFIQNYIPYINKVRIAFIKYVSPFANLIAGIAMRSYLITGFSLFGLYSLLSTEYYKTTIETRKSLPSITSLEQFQKLWTDLHQEGSQTYFEMNRTRVPQIQIPDLDHFKHSEDKILEVFDIINWDRNDFQEHLWDRISGIVEKDPKKAFKYPKEVISEEEKRAYRQEQLPRAKQMAKEWLVKLLRNTPRQDFLCFKQNICKILLENKNLLEEKIASEQSINLFKGLLTLIFGSGGQCLVAEEMKIKEAYLEIYKACNKETNRSQSDFLLLLELLYKNTTEQACKDILNPILQKTFTHLAVHAKNSFEYAQENLAEQWKSRSLSRISLLTRSIFSYLAAKFTYAYLEEYQKNIDLNSVHNFTRVLKLFGRSFNIVTDVDEVAERAFSEIAMNPLSFRTIKAIDTAISFSLEKFYWDTQLEKIIQPWLSTHFEEKTYFQLNNLTQWFFDLLEGFKTKDNATAIDNMQEGLWEEIPKVNGYPIAQEQNIQGEIVFKPTVQSLLLFAYGIHLLKMRDPESSFNYIDKKMDVFKINKIDFTNFAQVEQMLKFFMPQTVLSQLEEVNKPENKEIIDRKIISFREHLVSLINKETLFFV